MNPFTVLSTACKACNHLLTATSNVCESVEVISETLLDGTKKLHAISNVMMEKQYQDLAKELAIA